MSSLHFLSPSPVYKDLKTPRPFVEDLTQYGDDGSSAAAAKEDHVYMDAMGFGMGCSCLQMTFQACNIREARVLYDHLTPLCPVMVRKSHVYFDHVTFLIILIWLFSICIWVFYLLCVCCKLYFLLFYFCLILLAICF